ncbi:uncharacterized protein si:dkeyp-50b9.1 [Oncorhynchus nerka]|uniref:uncharacterized protein si:dkeyp-50b9.1 n=1 Tax=Oncorhynchus nerka TaxID=8023 RepID=UPI0011326A20|nr:uncharacterized protein LOC115134370 [Oncorhynchus nerka]XP_029524116.1 uncharacterized protein LOC115134370 [Oncorhynchus nerka]XP_035646742.1 uncharacterized protein si:dkeyp-50b9.1 isoform X1 [Oncorhynchus keta]
MDGCVVRLHTVKFKPKIDGSRGDFTAQPIKVHFYELLGISDANELVPQVENKDILSSVVALFDVSLPDVGPRDVHDTVHSHGTHTIILLRQPSDVLEEYRSRPLPIPRREPVRSPVPAVVNGDRESEGRYLQVFSESEDSSDDSSDEHEDGEEGTEPRSVWETFCTGLEEFLARARERRAQRDTPGDDQPLLPTAVGAESLIVGAAAYELKTLSTGEKVLQLSLMATRKRYRNCGVGRYIIELLKTQSVCGTYDAFLAHADTDAVDFFSRCGLTDDALLNDKFREVRDEWTNTTLMSYLPPFTTESESRNPGFSLMLPELKLEVEMARTKALAAYQQQAVCVTRLVREVKTLREQLELQRRDVDNLNNELDKERERRHRVEQQFLEYKLRKTRQLLERQVIYDSDDPNQNDPESPSEPISSPPSPLDLSLDAEM